MNGALAPIGRILSIKIRKLFSRVQIPEIPFMYPHYLQ